MIGSTDFFHGAAPQSANAGVDDEPVSGLLTFAPGETTKQVIVPILSDTLEEADEVFLFEVYAILQAGSPAAATGSQFGVAAR